MANHVTGEEGAYGERVEGLQFRLGWFGATVPILFFIVYAVTISVFFSIRSGQGPPEIALVMGAIGGLILGLFLMRGSWASYCQGIFDGMAQPVGVVAIVAWFWAGMFAQVLQVGGLVDGLVWLGTVTGVQGPLFVVATFVLAATFASAVGTGFGTTVAFCTLMFPAGLLVGADPVLMFGAILSGAAFGDNLAPVSDTTIVSAVTQETDVPGVVRSRFKYAIVAAIPAAVLFFLVGLGREGLDLSGTSAGALTAEIGPRGLVLLVPFALVILLALGGQHIITAMTWGILVGVAFIPLFGLGELRDVFYVDVVSGEVGGALVNGVQGFLTMSILILLIVASAHLMRLGGALEQIKRTMMGFIHQSVRRAEVAIWSVVASLNVFITINTAAEIAAAPFVSEVGKLFRLHPYRRANILDATTSALGYIFPWSGGVLVGYATLRTLAAQYDWIPAIAPTEVWPFVFHGWLLLVVMLIAALTGYGRTYEGPDGSETKEPPPELTTPQVRA